MAFYVVHHDEGRKKNNTSLHEYKLLFILSKWIEASVVCVRQTAIGRQDRLLYWLITSSLDHSTLCYLQDPLNTFSASWPGLLNRRSLEAIALSRVFWLTESWPSLWPSQSPTLSTAVGIYIYHFIMPTYFWSDHMNFFRLFIQVHLWLTARSRVNM